MRDFYKNALVRLLALLAFSCVAAYACLTASYLHEPLLPLTDGALHFRTETWENSSADKVVFNGGADNKSLGFDYRIGAGADYHFANAQLVFVDKTGKNRLVDLSRFSSISMDATCSPSMPLLIILSTFDPKVSKGFDFLTFPPPQAYGTCRANGSHIDLDLTRLAIPGWWFSMAKVPPDQQEYRLDKVAQLGFGLSTGDPAGTTLKVRIKSLTLNGRDYRYLYALGVLLLATWAGYAVWYYRSYSRALVGDVQAQRKQDLPLVAYQQLSLEPHRDKEKSAILRLVGTRYADPDLDLETIVEEAGINRNKVNEILKAELGHTFTSYVNKLRLTEAARLLAEEDGAAIAEIAYSVGYKNVSYFNRLFKEEYNCTPKTFRDLCKN